MSRNVLRLAFLNIGHAYDHLFMLLYATVVLALEDVFQMTYGELIALSFPGFAAFAAGALPAGWLGDRWDRTYLLAAFFLGIGGASILTGLAQSPWQIAVGLSLIGLFASIYHPVGIAMVVEGREKVGKVLGINGVFGNLGVAGAAIVAGLLTQTLGWRAAFIVPGAIAAATGIVYIALVRGGWMDAARAVSKSSRDATGAPFFLKALLILAIASLFGGLIFNVTTVALPKIFDERLTGLATTTLGVGSLASIVFAVAAFSQIAVGYLIDRFPMKPVLVVVVGAQIPLLLLAASSHDGLMLGVAVIMMALVFGEIPIHDALIARFTSDAWRSRIYAIKYVITLGVSALAIPLVSLTHRSEGGFTTLFVLMAGFVVIILTAVAFLPVSRRSGSTVPAGAGAGGPSG
jgi:MFS family permease